MEITCKTVETDARPVLFGLQNSIPCQEEFKNAVYGVYQQKENPDKLAVKIVGDKLIMLGTGDKESKTEKLFLGVFNKEKAEVKMIATTDVISVAQSVDGFEPRVISKDDSLDYIKRRKMLVDVFGNKKSKQILKQRENARIETTSVIGGKSMESILKIKGENKTDLSAVTMKGLRKSKKRA